MKNGSICMFVAAAALLFVSASGRPPFGGGSFAWIPQAYAEEGSLEESEDEGADLAGFEEGGDEESDLAGFEEDGNEESDLAGFGDGEEDEDLGAGLNGALDFDVDKILSASESQSALIFGGFVKEAVSYGFAYEDPEWAKLKSSVNLTFDYTFSEIWKSKLNINGFYDYAYRYRSRDEFSDETLETYESEVEIRDFYVDGSFPNQIYFRFGRQVVAWGVSNYDQINDMVNPRYQRELGMVDLEDARLPVVASKFTKVFGSFDVSFVAIHEIRGNKMGVKGSEFDPFVSLRGGAIAIEEEQIPDSEVANTEFALRFSKLFNGGDVALVYANCYDDEPYLDFTKAVKSGSQMQLTVTPKHKRIWSLGFDGSLASGSWLYKAELAKKYNLAKGRGDLRKQMAGLPEGEYGEDSKAVKTWMEKKEVRVMVGVEYSGISDLTITLEGVKSKIEEHEENLSSRENAIAYYLMFDYSSMNDALKTKLMGIHLSDDDGFVLRGNVEYDFIDALTGTLGAILYEAEEKDARLYPYRKNDKIFASIKYSF